MGETSTELHQSYHLANGTPLPSVTGIIGANLGWGKDALLGWTAKMVRANLDPVKVRDRAGEVGTVAHHQIEHWLDTKWNLGKGTSSIDGDEWAPSVVRSADMAFGAFLDWFKSTGYVPLHSEAQLVSELHEFGGTLDLIVDCGNGRKAQVDFKTSNSIKEGHIIQVSAYHELAVEAGLLGDGDDTIILWLGKSARVYETRLISPEVRTWGWHTFKHLLGIEECRRYLEGDDFGLYKEWTQ